MKLCRYGQNELGVVADDAILPLNEAFGANSAPGASRSMEDLIEALVAGPRPAINAGARRVPLAGTRLLAPVTRPPAIWAAAANYRAHQAEMIGRVGSYDRSQLTADDLMAELFLKPRSSITGPGGPVVLPTISRHVDFECELCAVIGKPARRVSEERALDHVFGYLLCWDISVRDPWGKGGRHNTRNIRKGFDSFTAIGPWIVTADEVADPQDQHIQVEQNGKPVMTAHTADMINGLRPIIRFLSSVSTLETGTLITTGTPAGVSKLAPGDHLRGTISGIGTMELDVVAEAG